VKINRIAVLTLTLALVAFLVYYFRSIVAYILVAWVISMIGAPLMRLLLRRLHFDEWKYGPALASAIVLFLFVGFIALLFSIFAPLVVEQARNFWAMDYAAMGESLSEPISWANQQLYNLGLVDDIKSPSEQMQDFIENLLKPALVGDFFGSLLGIAGNLLIAIFSIIFIAFFFLKETGLFVNFIKAMVPNQYEEKTVSAIDEMSYLLTRYFGGLVLQVLSITLIVSLSLKLLGVQNAILIGFFAAIINLIPYVGPFIGATFGILVTISANVDLDFYTQMLPLIGKVAAVFACMQMIDNFILQPFIFSNSVKAHPLEIFVVILVGAQLGGILGMVLAIPTYTVLRVIAKTFLSQFKVVQKITRSIQ
jgi:predicted PurR-regulated permease PerM